MSVSVRDPTFFPSAATILLRALLINVVATGLKLGIRYGSKIDGT